MKECNFVFACKSLMHDVTSRKSIKESWDLRGLVTIYKENYEGLVASRKVKRGTKIT
jgi:hypothetical protein